MDIDIKNEFLPIGTVVLLKEATRKVVIIGFAVVESGSSNVWDYLACAYPIGVISSESNLLFNREQIDKVVSLGYSDEEEKSFRSKLKNDIRMLGK